MNVMTLFCSLALLAVLSMYSSDCLRLNLICTLYPRMLGILVISLHGVIYCH